MIYILQNQLQNIPVIGWFSMKTTTTSRNDNCSIYPNIYTSKEIIVPNQNQAFIILEGQIMMIMIF